MLVIWSKQIFNGCGMYARIQAWYILEDLLDLHQSCIFIGWFNIYFINCLKNFFINKLCRNYIFFLFQSIFTFSILGYEEMIAGDYTYPTWSINMGWALTASSILCIPAYIVYLFCITSGSFLQVRNINFYHVPINFILVIA